MADPTFILVDGLGNALIDGLGNALGATVNPPAAPIPDFATCVGLAEMHRQSRTLDNLIAAAGDTGLLERLSLISDVQYFNEVLGCALQFNTSAPAAVDGLQIALNRLTRQQ